MHMCMYVYLSLLELLFMIVYHTLQGDAYDALPIFYAAAHGHVEVVQHLLNQGVNVNDPVAVRQATTHCNIE